MTVKDVIKEFLENKRDSKSLRKLLMQNRWIVPIPDEETGKVIGVNFGIFTENTAANMALPIKYAIDLLRQAGWKSPEEIQTEQNQLTQIANANTNTNTQVKP